LSPLLFDFYIDDLANFLEQQVNCKLYLYADDLAVLVDDVSGA
jgi:hypothetical protein